MIKGYQNDNDIFNALEFMEELSKKQRNVRFSGARASRQNWPSERAIKTVFTMARKIFLYVALRYPEGILSTDIWPTAMNYYVWVYNQIPDMQS